MPDLGRDGFQTLADELRDDSLMVRNSMLRFLGVMPTTTVRVCGAGHAWGDLGLLKCPTCGRKLLTAEARRGN